MSAGFACRSCGGQDTTLVVDLGVQPLANNLLRPADLGKPEPRHPLRVAVCESCWLLQITDLVPPTDLFSDYVYFSSFSDAMLRHAREAAERYVREFSLGPQSHVVEIASNDGYLLKNFVAAGVPCLGIEPAANIARVADGHGVPTLVEFFGEALARRLADEGRRTDLILGNNVFAHAPQPNDFVAGLKVLLAPGGRIVLEFPYGVDLIEHTEFDTIYHEHVFYFTLTALAPLLARHGLVICDVERLPIHGGSLRIFARHAEEAPVVAESVARLRAAEQAAGVDSAGYYAAFTRNVHRIRDELLALLARLRADGRSVAAYGASAKGSTLLNFVQPPADTFDFIADRSTYKQGLVSPGMHLPIVPPAALLERQPEYTLLLTWNFAAEILEQQKEYRARGGKFILPIPEVRIA